MPVTPDGRSNEPDVEVASRSAHHVVCRCARTARLPCCVVDVCVCVCVCEEREIQRCCHPRLLQPLSHSGRGARHPHFALGCPRSFAVHRRTRRFVLPVVYEAVDWPLAPGAASPYFGASCSIKASEVLGWTLHECHHDHYAHGPRERRRALSGHLYFSAIVCGVVVFLDMVVGSNGGPWLVDSSYSSTEHH